MKLVVVTAFCGKTVIFGCFYKPLVINCIILARLSDRIGILKDGRLLAVGTAEELKTRAGAEDFESAFVKIVKEDAV